MDALISIISANFPGQSSAGKRAQSVQLVSIRRGHQ